MASYTLQGFTNDASSADLDGTNLNEMDNAIKKGHDFADSASSSPSAGKAMVWPENASGTFTPTLMFGGASVGITYETQLGYYTKIGNVCKFSVRIILTSKGTSAGDVRIGGLPFVAINSVANMEPCLFISNATRNGSPVAYVMTNTTLIQLQGLADTGVATSLNHTNFTNTSYIMASGVYITA